MGPYYVRIGTGKDARLHANDRVGHGRTSARGPLLMVYVDTSVLVALCVREAMSATVGRWYAGCSEELGSATWCVTEFASALGIKQRIKQISADQAGGAWEAFERLCASDLQLLAVEPPTFHRAAMLTLDATTGLRAGDALHLAAALDAKASSLATLDDVLARNAMRMNISPTGF
ncbi:type II toxin-antitoxin system VapC family toxin [Paraburkholderia sp. GAS41]|uniref:type II toxin-antitoxin system VapC family toxin n=1 Tax=Paraburkholderia sp. GAS41 TaxID=3035134 RepID=UPI003D1CC3FB